MLFHYAATPHVRQHGPHGYQDARSYKPWLRDELAFQCVYCLCRERWFPDGDDNMSIDHVRPRRAAPAQHSTYENLVYACCQCNASKQDAMGVLDPCEEPFGRHLEVLDDGTIRALTPPGVALIRICRLDRPKLTAFRREILEVWRTLERRHGLEAAAMHQRFFGLPANLPNLAALRPPGGNTRPQGIAQSYAERQRRGELPSP
jgi:hypothetical protein